MKAGISSITIVGINAMADSEAMHGLRQVAGSRVCKKRYHSVASTRTVGKDSCVNFEKLSLQIPKDQHRYHYVKTKVHVHRYLDNSLAVFH
jgi:hypothetical protein